MEPWLRFLCCLQIFITLSKHCNFKYWCNLTIFYPEFKDRCLLPLEKLTLSPSSVKEAEVCQSQQMSNQAPLFTDNFLLCFIYRRWISNLTYVCSEKASVWTPLCEEVELRVSLYSQTCLLAVTPAVRVGQVWCAGAAPGSSLAVQTLGTHPTTASESAFQGCPERMGVSLEEGLLCFKELCVSVFTFRK